VTEFELSFAKSPSARQVIDLADPSRPQSQLVITLLLHVFRLFPFLVGGHRRLALENLALRQQLAVYKRMAPRPRLHTMDRLFWAGLARVWAGWRQALVIVSPDTVLRWQRASAPTGPGSRVGLLEVVLASIPRSGP
jgi:hypothetical protein